MIFRVLFGLSLFAEFLANDKPILVSYHGELLHADLQVLPRDRTSAAISGPRRSIATSRSSA